MTYPDVQLIMACVLGLLLLKGLYEISEWLIIVIMLGVDGLSQFIEKIIQVVNWSEGDTFNMCLMKDE